MSQLGLGLGLTRRCRTGAWTPAILGSSLALWLKADAGLYQERTGASATTPAAADGDPVGSWLDQSGNGRHLTAAADSNRPILKLAIQNGRPVVRFDGTDDYLRGSDAMGLHGLPGATAFVVKKSAVWGGRAWGNTGGSSDYFGFSDGDNATPSTRPNFGTGTSGGTLLIATGPTNRDAFAGVHLITGRAAPDSVQVWDNGVAGAELTTSWGGGTISCNSPKYAGVQEVAGNPAAGEFLSGDMAELIVCNTALSTADRQQVESYLNTRWALY